MTRAPQNRGGPPSCQKSRIGEALPPARNLESGRPSLLPEIYLRTAQTERKGEVTHDEVVVLDSGLFDQGPRPPRGRLQMTCERSLADALLSVRACR